MTFTNLSRSFWFALPVLVGCSVDSEPAASTRNVTLSSDVVSIGAEPGEACYAVSDDLELGGGEPVGQPVEPSELTARTFALNAPAKTVWCEYRGTGNGTKCPPDNDPGAQVKFCIAQEGGQCEKPLGTSQWSIKDKDCTFAQMAYVASPGACPNKDAKYNFKWSGSKIQPCK